MFSPGANSPKIDYKPSRVICSCTTMPERYAKLLRTLRTLSVQTVAFDAIYVGIPARSRRLDVAYPPVPVDINMLATIVPLEIDYGPVTKIVAGLTVETDPDTVIITVDDDILYAPTFVETMLAKHRIAPNACIASSGALIAHGFPFYSTHSNCPKAWNGLTSFDVPDTGRAVDIVCGFSGVLYIRKFFPTKELLHADFLHYALEDDNVLYNDDVFLSGFLARQKITRLIFDGIPMTDIDKVWDPEIDRADTFAISASPLRFLWRFMAAIDTMKKWGFFPEFEPVDSTETIGVRVVLAVISIIVLLVIVGWLLFSEKQLFPDIKIGS